MSVFSQLASRGEPDRVATPSPVTRARPAPSVDVSNQQVQRQLLASPVQVQRACTKCEDEERVQRKCATCEDEEHVQRQESDPQAASGPVESAPPIVHDVLRSRGQPLDAVTRAFFEPRFRSDVSGGRATASRVSHSGLTVGPANDPLEREADLLAEDALRMPSPSRSDRATERAGIDFSRVRIHTDARAAASTRAVNAVAYTVGEHIVFGSGRYAPGTDTGRQLLAHELVHTIQQAGSVATAQLHRTIGDGHDLQSPRFAGDLVLEAAFDGEGPLRVGSKGPAVVKIQQALIDAGFPLPKFGADGDFGLETQTAVRNFQQANGLVPDGVVGTGTMGTLDTREQGSVPPKPQGRELTAEELAAIKVVGQAAVTPDGNTLGPTNPALRGCLGNRFFFRKGTDVNTTTAARVVSFVTAQLGQPPADAAECSCGCGLFRQFIKGFWRAGTPTSAKQFATGSCGNPITMSETTFTEEFVNCITGGVPIGPGCTRNQADSPGAASGLAEGTFFQLHMVLRYQMSDQCRARSLGMADHVLDISGSNSPRRITFT